MTDAELRELAERATCPKCDGERRRVYADSSCGRGAGGQTVTVGACWDCRATGVTLEFIATCSPSTILRLLDRLQSAEAVCEAAERWRDAELAFREHSFFDTAARADKRMLALDSERALIAAIDARRNSKETGR